MIATRKFYVDVAVAGAAAEVAAVVGFALYEALAIRSKTGPSCITRTFRRCAFTMKADTFCCLAAFSGLRS